jgi:hypothetical protein
MTVLFNKMRCLMEDEHIIILYIIIVRNSTLGLSMWLECYLFANVSNSFSQLKTDSLFMAAQ